MQKWEYCSIALSYKAAQYPSYWKWKEEWLDDPKDGRAPEQRLDRLGQEGWELVSVVPRSVTERVDWAGITTHVTFYLKRPLETTK